MFRRLDFFFRPFWPCSGSCILISSGLFGHLKAAALFFFGRFGYVQSAAFLSFLAVFAMFRRLHYHFFRPFWPCSGGCIFIISGRIWLCCDRCIFIVVGPLRHVQAAAVLLLLAVLAMFRRLDLKYFRPFCPCSEGCIFIISGRFGHVQAAPFLLFLAVLAMFRRLHY